MDPYKRQRKKAEIFVDAFGAQLSLNSGQNLPEFITEVQTVNDTMTQIIFFTSGIVQLLLKNSQKEKLLEKIS